MKTLKVLSNDDERLLGGHRLCPGCGLSIIMRQVLHATTERVVMGCATGCLEVSTTVFPDTAWNVPWIHTAFENVAPTMSGVEAAYRSLKKQGKISGEMRFLAVAGDGGTYDIGLQALSGMLERGHRIVFVCLDNEAYQNTGVQKSGATPFGAMTNTTPVGTMHKGKEIGRKDIVGIVAAHNIPYVAQASPHNFMDLMRKAEKAFDTDGPSFLNILSPCIPGWGTKAEDTVDLAKLAVDTCFWPLFEIIDGKWVLNYDPGEKKRPIADWCKIQKRFSHLMLPENSSILGRFQTEVDTRWTELKRKCEVTS